MSKLFQEKGKIIVTCPKRIAPYLSKEISTLGLPVIQESFMGVETQGTMLDCIRLNLQLRTAHRVLYLIKSFTARNPQHLYDALSLIPWEDYIEESGYLSVSSYTDNEEIRDTRFANLKTKDAIVDRLQSTKGSRPDSGPDQHKTVVFLHWKEEQASIYIDTSGETIAKHHYRKHPGLAPLQETLAAALLLASRWNQRSAFINPMCGSGTLAIEAALLATQRAPGLLRSNFGFMHVKGFEQEVYEKIRKEIKQIPSPKINFPIIATDLDARVIRDAKNNAQTAGVDHLIQFEVCDFRDTPIPEGEGVVMLNPEYGERLGEESELEGTYKAIGDFFKQKCKGKTGYIFTGNMELAKKIGLKTKRRIEFYNSKIDCRLLEFELYEGTRKIVPSETI